MLFIIYIQREYRERRALLCGMLKSNAVDVKELEHI